MRQIQIIKCKCGKAFAACAAPECYADADWQKDMRKYVGSGCTVEIVNSGEWDFEDCVCNGEQGDLFAESKPIKTSREEKIKI